MKLILMLVIFSIIFSVVLLFIVMFVSKKMTMNREKSSPFECGFDPGNFARIPFSLRFFLLAVIFLIFDIEVVLLLPFVLSLSDSLDFFSLFSSIMFLILVLFGLLYEWKEGSLSWMN
uniref:NADH-ubiquinone oxidoreductase chain 3 n=1 Tax=Callochiton steinenii TaxID=2719128 RepID=A0A6H1PG98_9MOLL|nr:NADH dehydrogenase subunit 3 [Callochiton steinenii]